MDLTVHQQVLLLAFTIAAVMGAVANKTQFCTLGAVSDWINIGDTGRMRAWLLAIAVAVGGVTVLQAAGVTRLGSDTFPAYRTPQFVWLRYVLGGLMFGVGMTLASGCANKTLVRIGGGNLKSVLVLAIASIAAYLMVWTNFYAVAFNSWLGPTAIKLEQHGVSSQAIGDVVAGLERSAGAFTYNILAGAVISMALAAFVFASKEFRHNFDNLLGGFVVGLAVVAGWYITAGPLGVAWKEWAEFSPMPPSRVEAQSYTFVSPMADTLRYLMDPTNTGLVNFGVMALLGVLLGSFAYAVISRSFRIEWFAHKSDFVRHVFGGVLLGIGGVLSMGCTIGQAVTGTSTLALGSFLTFASIVVGAIATMKYQYWRMLRER